MDPKKAKQLQDEIGEVLSKYGLDGIAGVTVKQGMIDAGIMLYNPADFPTRTVVLAMNEKLKVMIRAFTGCGTSEHTGFTDNGTNN